MTAPLDLDEIASRHQRNPVEGWCGCGDDFPCDAVGLLAELRAARAQIAAALAAIDGQIEAFIAANPARVNEYGYYLLQEIRRALSGETP
jgi:hypothetical protein